MMVDTETMVSMTEANQNFSKVTRIVDEKGSAVILKNNVPKYIILEYKQIEENSSVSDEELLSVSKGFIEKNRDAYEVLAK
jgi:antitoxin Phd